MIQSHCTYASVRARIVTSPARIEGAFAMMLITLLPKDGVRCSHGYYRYRQC